MVYSHSLILPWSISDEEERRFRKVLTITLALTLALGIVIPLLPVLRQPVVQEVELPPRLAKLIFEKRVEPKKPEPRPVEKPKPEPVAKQQPKPEKKTKTPPRIVKRPEPKQPTVDTTQRAREKARKSGLLAMSDALADLRDQSSVNRLRGTTRLTNSGATATKTKRSLITTKAGTASAGIDTAGLSRDAGSTSLAARTTTEVKSSIAAGAGKKARAKGGSARSGGRSDEEIQVVFDQNKGAIYSLYNRELRKDPTLQGKLVLRLTIAPSGKVTHIEVLSSDLGMPALESKLIQRVKMFNFGAKPVDAVTVTYPIQFLPA
jgi:TonB family protein